MTSEKILEELVKNLTYKKWKNEKFSPISIKKILKKSNINYDDLYSFLLESGLVTKARWNISTWNTEKYVTKKLKEFSYFSEEDWIKQDTELEVAKIENENLLNDSSEVEIKEDNLLSEVEEKNEDTFSSEDNKKIFEEKELNHSDNELAELKESWESPIFSFDSIDEAPKVESNEDTKLFSEEVNSVDDKNEEDTNLFNEEVNSVNNEDINLFNDENKIEEREEDTIESTKEDLNLDLFKNTNDKDESIENNEEDKQSEEVIRSIEDNNDDAYKVEEIEEKDNFEDLEEYKILKELEEKEIITNFIINSIKSNYYLTWNTLEDAINKTYDTLSILDLGKTNEEVTEENKNELKDELFSYLYWWKKIETNISEKVLEDNKEDINKSEEHNETIEENEKIIEDNITWTDIENVSEIEDDNELTDHFLESLEVIEDNHSNDITSPKKKFSLKNLWINKIEYIFWGWVFVLWTIISYFLL